MQAEVEIAWSSPDDWVSEMEGTVLTYTNQDITVRAEESLAKNPPIVNASSNELRIYASGTMLIKSQNDEIITHIRFNLSNRGLQRLSEMSVTEGTLSYDIDNKIVEWNGRSKEITITVGLYANLGTDGETAAAQFCVNSPIIVSVESGGNIEGGGDNNEDDYIQIKEAQEKAVGEYCKVRGTICATGMSGFLIGDDSDYIYYYNPSASNDYCVGDIITIEGELGSYGGFNQFVEGAKIQKKGRMFFDGGVPTIMTGSDFDAWVNNPEIKYVSVTGQFKLSDAYYNLVIDNTSVIGSLGYSAKDLLLSLEEGEYYTVTGYSFMSTGRNKYICIIADKIVKVGEELTDTPTMTPEVSVGAVCLNVTSDSALDFGTAISSYRANGITVTFSIPAHVEKSPTGYKSLRIESATDITISSDNGNKLHSLTFGLDDNASFTADGEKGSITKFNPIWKGEASSQSFVAAKSGALYYLIADYTSEDEGASTTGAYNLSVLVPDVDNRIINKYIVFENKTAQVTQKFVIAPGAVYTLSSIPDKSEIDVYFADARSKKISAPISTTVNGCDQTIEISQENLPAFSKQTVKVIGLDKTDYSNVVTIEWFDEEGNKVASGNSLVDAIKGWQYTARITLPDNMISQYLNPEDIGIIATESDSAITVDLKTIEEISIKGRTTDSTTGNYIPGVDVAVTQTFANGRKILTPVKSDNQGLLSVNGKVTATDISISKSGYLTASYSFSGEQIEQVRGENSTIDIGDLKLTPITGTEISIGLQYQDNDGVTSKIYPNLKDIDVKIYDSQSSELIPVSFEYPKATLLKTIAANTKIIINITSKSDAFASVEKEYILAEEGNHIDFVIKENGKISITAEFSDANSAHQALIFDDKGHLASSASYDADGKTSTANLPDGKYSVVSIQAGVDTTWPTLAALTDAKLEAGRDYTLVEDISVSCGKTTHIDAGLVPLLSQDVFSYIGSASSVGLSKNVVSAGNLVTASVYVDFKEEIQGRVSDLQLIVQIPDGVLFKDNSVMVGAAVGAYSYDSGNNQLMIGLPSSGAKARFCISPLKGGESLLNVMASFSIDGKTVLQPIGNARLTSRNLSLQVSSVTPDEYVSVSGDCPGSAEVRLYDGDVLVGNAKADAAGHWSGQFKLDRPYNLSTHTLQARITCTDGTPLVSDTKDVTINQYEIVATKVTMINSDHSSKQASEQATVFDLENHRLEGNAYYRFWPASPDFSFIVDLTNNSEDAVEELGVIVYTTRDNWVALPGSYNKELGKWTASGKFKSTELPVGVSVNVKVYTPLAADRALLRDADDEVTQIIADYNDSKQTVDEEYEIEIDPEYAAYLDGLTEEELEAKIAADEDMAQLLAESDELTAMSDIMFAPSIADNSELAALSGIKYIDYKERTEEQWLADGFEKRGFTDGSAMYVRSDGYTVDVVDDAEKVHWQYTVINQSKARQQAPMQKISKEELRNKAEETIGKIYGALETLQGEYEKLEAKFGDLDEIFKKHIKHAETDIADRTKSLEFQETKLKQLNKELESASSSAEIKNINQKIEKTKTLISKRQKEIKAAKKIIKRANNSIKDLVFLKGWFKKTLPFVKYTLMIKEAVDNVKSLLLVNDYVPDFCECDPYSLQQLQDEAYASFLAECSFMVGRLGVEALNDLISAGMLISTGGAALPVVGFKQLLKKIAIDLAYDFVHTKAIHSWKHSFLRRVDMLKKHCNKPCYEDDDDDDIDNKRFLCSCKNMFDCTCNAVLCICRNCNEIPIPTVDPIQDPSGFVYEGVEDNRLEGVTASLYFKRADSSGEDSADDVAVLWEARNYGQENPVLTDNNGYYHWDVPEGLWQVRFEKTGYEPVATEWLPVPPPQLDVNVAMRQLVAPAVESVSATPSAVTISFSKFMLTSTLDASHIFVKENGAIVGGNIEFGDKSMTPYGELASMVIFHPDSEILAKEVEISIRKDVESYANIPMGKDVYLTAEVQSEVSSITVEEVPALTEGGSASISVSITPPVAGVSILATSLSQSIVSVQPEIAETDERGMARFTVDGHLAGTVELKLSVVNSTVETRCSITVEQVKKTKVGRVRSSVSTDAPVEAGTLIYLFNDTPDAVILYTTDGSNPQILSESVTVYSGEPIKITESMDIKAYATAEGMEDSDLALFRYIVKPNSGIADISISGNAIQISPVPMRDVVTITAGEMLIRQVGIYDASGVCVALNKSSRGERSMAIDVAHLVPAAYIIIVDTDSGSFSTKCLKQ